MPDPTTPVPAPAPPAISESVTTCRTAHFVTRWLPPSTAIVAAHGEIDAANAHYFADYALHHAGQMSNLVIGLEGVEFFSSAGFSALHALNVRCAAEGIHWAMAPSKAVKRLLQICDPDSVLPVRTSVEAALAQVASEPPPLLQLVPQSR